MKKLFLLAVILYCSNIFTACAKDEIDSLKRKISICANDTVRANLFTQLAAHYLNYDNITDRRAKQIAQENALDYTLSAVQQYSRYNDTLGLRSSYDVLVRIYRDQKQLVQAKWFILQSNTLSRGKKDVPNIITSLVELAAIKTELKDYSLAVSDLNEANLLANKNHLPQLASNVQLGYAMLYNHMGNFTKANLALKKHVDIDDSIRKADETPQLAAVAAQDTAIAKKKVTMISSKKISKTSLYRKTASL